jgi:uncharacterized membrane protein
MTDVVAASHTHYRRYFSLASGLSLLLSSLVLFGNDATAVVAIQSVLAVLVAGYIPGRYILYLLDIEAEGFERVLYSAGFSVITLMLYGFVVNAVYLLVGLPIQPFSEESVVLGLLGLALVGAGTDEDLLGGDAKAFINDVTSWPQVYVLSLSMVGWAVLGSYYVNAGLGRWLIFAFFGLLAVVALVVVLGDLPPNAVRVLLYSSTFSLLLQDLIRTPYLSRVGDTQFEYYFANLSIVHGFWEPTVYSTKSTSLFLNAFYPTVEILSGLDLFEVFTVVYPAIFAAIAVSLFELYRGEFYGRAAVVGALLYVFSDQFFILLSRSTRTGMAIFMITLFALAITDLRGSPRSQKVLASLFLFSLVFIHYGTAVVFSFVLVVLYLFAVSVRLLMGQEFWALSWKTLMAYAIFMVSWFSYTGSGRTFDIAVFNLYLILRRALGAEVDRSTSVQVATKELPSVTSQLIRFEYLVLVLLAATAAGILILRYLWRIYSEGETNPSIRLPLSPHDVSFDHTNLWFPVVGFSLLLISFAPSSIFRINRIYMIAAVFLLPFSVVTLSYLYDRVTLGFDGARPLLAVSIVVVLLLNTGTLGVYVFGDISHQVTIDKNLIEERGDPDELNELYVNHFPPSDYHASAWISAHLSPNEVVYGGLGRTEWLSYFSYEERSSEDPPGPYQGIGWSVEEEGYLFINKYTAEVYPAGSEERLRTEEESSVPQPVLQRERCNKVYSNSGSSVFKTPC